MSEDLKKSVMAVGGLYSNPLTSVQGGFPFKTAILIDAGWFSKALGKLLNSYHHHPSVEDTYQYAIKALTPEEVIYRIFYYDSRPYDGYTVHPVTGNRIEYGNTPSFSARNRFFNDMSRMPYVALRRGHIKPRGWVLSEDYQKRLISAKQNNIELKAEDIYFDFEQKGVDMRIGIDIATLSIKRLVDRIILFSGDTDMIPAIKLARMEGIQIFGVEVGNWKLSNELYEHCDIIRRIGFDKC